MAKARMKRAIWPPEAGASAHHAWRPVHFALVSTCFRVGQRPNLMNRDNMISGVLSTTPRHGFGLRGSVDGSEL